MLFKDHLWIVAESISYSWNEFRVQCIAEMKCWHSISMFPEFFGNQVNVKCICSGSFSCVRLLLLWLAANRQDGCEFFMLCPVYIFLQIVCIKLQFVPDSMHKMVFLSRFSFLTAVDFIAEEMDWDKNGMVNFKEFLFAFTRWVGIEDNDDEEEGGEEEE